MSARSFTREMISHVRHHYYLWPIIGFVTVGPGLAVYCIVKKIDGPETTRLFRQDPEHHNKFEHKKYRIYEPTKFDYENYHHPRESAKF